MTITTVKVNSNNLQEHLEQLKIFLSTAPTHWEPHEAIRRFALPHGDYISCVLWNNLFHVTGTDIVKSLMFRFLVYGRPVANHKKFEEGVFSDLRNLKPGVDATLEEPRSEFLEMLYKNNCIRTQKKQKVFYWYSVPHDRLFRDALERDLKREALGIQATTLANGAATQDVMLAKQSPNGNGHAIHQFGGNNQFDSPSFGSPATMKTEVMNGQVTPNVSGLLPSPRPSPGQAELHGLPQLQAQSVDNGRSSSHDVGNVATPPGCSENEMSSYMAVAAAVTYGETPQNHSALASPILGNFKEDLPQAPGSWVQGLVGTNGFPVLESPNFAHINATENGLSLTHPDASPALNNVALGDGRPNGNSQFNSPRMGSGAVLDAHHPLDHGSPLLYRRVPSTTEAQSLPGGASAAGYGIAAIHAQDQVQSAMSSPAMNTSIDDFSRNAVSASNSPLMNGVAILRTDPNNPPIQGIRHTERPNNFAEEVSKALKKTQAPTLFKRPQGSVGPTPLSRNASKKPKIETSALLGNDDAGSQQKPVEYTVGRSRDVEVSPTRNDYQVPTPAAENGSVTSSTSNSTLSEGANSSSPFITSNGDMANKSAHTKNPIETNSPTSPDKIPQQGTAPSTVTAAQGLTIFS